MSDTPESMGGGRHKTVGYAEAEVAAATREANSEASYYVDPNEHQPEKSGDTEPAADPKDGDLMIGQDTGGQDNFGYENPQTKEA